MLAGIWRKRPGWRGLLGIIVGLMLVAVTIGRLRPHSPQARADSSMVVTAMQITVETYIRPVNPVGLLNAAIAGLRAASKLGPKELPDLPIPLPEDDAVRIFRQAFATAARAGTVAEGDLATAATKAMLDSLHDPHTTYLEPKRFAAIMNPPGGGPAFSGIGLSLMTLTAPSGMRESFVFEVFPGAPAEQAGIKRFDRIVRVEGQPANNMTMAQISGLLRGPAGTTARLTVRRSDREFTAAIVRRPINIPSAAARMIRPGVAYLRLFTLSRGAGSALENAVHGLEAHAAVRAVVLDVRDNHEGLAEEAERVAGLFLPPGTKIGQTVEHGKLPRALVATGTPFLSQTRMAILAGRATGQAAEVLIAGLRDAGRARIFGEKTAGDTGEENIYQLAVGGIAVTSKAISRPREEPIEGIGIPPDTVSRVTWEAASKNEDAPLEAALKFLAR